MSLPDFLIIGTQRGGTTSLWEYLRAHPDVVIFKTRKEIHFFDKKWGRGLEFYRQQFPSKKGKQITGEATPNYLFYEKALPRIKAMFPKIKIIILLRNPIERAWSHYLLMRNQGKEHLSFGKALKVEKRRIKQSREALQDFSYRSRGIYIEQIKRWFSAFPREQFLVIKSENFFSNPKKIYEEVLKFLNLRPYIPNVVKEKRRFQRTSRTTTFNPEIRKELKEFYEPYNKELYKFLKRDFGWK